MKRYIGIALVLALCLCMMPTSTQAAARDLKVVVNGKQVSFPDGKPFIDNGSTLIPIRFVAEALNYKVDWDPVTRTALIGENGRIKIVIGSTDATVDGATVTMPVKARIANGGRTYVPLRFVSENLNSTVDWFDSNSTIVVASRNEDGSETPVFERLAASGLFWVLTDTRKGCEGRRTLVLKTMCTEKQAADQLFATRVTTANDVRWFMEEIQPASGGIDSAYAAARGCYLSTKNFSLQTRREIKQVLMAVYPTGYATVYSYMMQTILNTIWEAGRPLVAGTYGLHYVDGRSVSMEYELTAGRMTICFVPIGYQYEELPKILDDYSISVNNSEGNSSDMSGSKWFRNYWQLDIYE